MAGDWIKIEHALPDKPEVMQMADMLGVDPDAIVGKLIRVWTWFDNHTVDGNAPVTVRPLLDRYAGVQNFVTAMLHVGWLAESNDCLTVCRFERHNGQSAKNRSNTNRRVAKSRKRNGAAVTNVTPPPLHPPLQKPLPEKRREEKSNVSITQSARAHEIPTVEQAMAYAASAPVPISDACAGAFHDTQQACGWITKHGHSIADWRAALRRYASLWNEHEKAKPATKPDHRQTKAATEYPEPRTKLPRL